MRLTQDKVHIFRLFNADRKQLHILLLLVFLGISSASADPHNPFNCTTAGNEYANQVSPQSVEKLPNYNRNRPKPVFRLKPARMSFH
jgi:hypothetical protein